ncbi:phage repressor protein CI [Erwinia sp. 9145]|uniref:phage repressor protein CI n=1 Tax=Erwinia sp. 9145 TaxID=1500895 RepID=UPI0005522B41|nr:phage repressor protein CI [Erwinia sp. 9145]
MVSDTTFNNEELLNRICEVYGFTQKIQLANHFNIAASSLQNRYKRGNMSYDFAVHCALETGVNIQWLMTGLGEKRSGSEIPKSESLNISVFIFDDGALKKESSLAIDAHFFSKPPGEGIAVRTEGRLHFVDKTLSLTDGLWLVEIENTVSLRELTVLPGKKLHVTGGKVPFECAVSDIQLLGRVTGIYNEMS